MDLSQQFHQQNVHGQSCVPCAHRSTKRLVRLLDGRVLITEFDCLRDTRGAGLPVDATSTRALLVEIQSMPVLSAIRLVAVSSELDKRFMERPLCLEDARQRGLTDSAFHQIRFFSTLEVWFEREVARTGAKEYINVDVEETEAACMNGVYSGNCYATIYYDSSPIITFETESGSTHKCEIDNIGEFCDEWTLKQLF